MSSGAIAEGMQRLGWKQRPSAVHELQAAAAVGQMGLIEVCESCFRAWAADCRSATHEDMAGPQALPERALDAAHAVGTRRRSIINENDTVATDEIRLGDNDTLARW